MTSAANTISLPSNTSIGVFKWLVVLLLALAIHAAAFIVYGLPKVEPQGAKDDGQQGIEIGLRSIALPQITPVIKPEINKPVKTKPKKIKPVAKSTKKPAVKKTIPKPLAKPKPVPAIVNPAPVAPNTIEEVQQEAETSTSDNFESDQKVANITELQTSHTKTSSNVVNEAVSQAQKSSAGGASKARVSYRQLLLQKLDRHKRYPNAAMRRGQEAIIQLEFAIDKDGNVLSYRLIEPSKYKILNKAVERMIKKATPLPAVPSDLHTPSQEYLFVVPVKFELS